MNKEKEIVAISVDKEMSEKIVERAFKNGVTRSEYISRLIEKDMLENLKDDIALYAVVEICSDGVNPSVNLFLNINDARDFLKSAYSLRKEEILNDQVPIFADETYCDKDGDCARVMISKEQNDWVYFQVVVCKGITTDTLNALDFEAAAFEAYSQLRTENLQLLREIQILKDREIEKAETMIEACLEAVDTMAQRVKENDKINVSGTKYQEIDKIANTLNLEIERKLRKDQRLNYDFSGVVEEE